MKMLVLVGLLVMLIVDSIVCPPVLEKKKKPDKEEETEGEGDQEDLVILPVFLFVTNMRF